MLVDMDPPFIICALVITMASFMTALLLIFILAYGSVAASIAGQKNRRTIEAWLLTFVCGPLAIVIVASAVRGYADIEAYRYSESAILAPVAYLRLVLIALAGYFLFGEVPDLATVIGASIIISATLYIALREAKLRRANR